MSNEAREKVEPDVRVAVDIGGTFTDLVHHDEQGNVGIAKTLTTHGKLEDGVVNAFSEAGLTGASFLAHGTTVIINALTERTGARAALLTTRGFRDVVEIGRGNRPDLYNLRYAKPVPFVSREYRYEATERMSASGEVITPLLDDDVRQVACLAREQGIEAIAVCFLHSYANPEHELRAGDVIKAEWSDAVVSMSHELATEWREYERTSTAVLDAYVKPTATAYLGRLSRELDRLDVSGRRRFVMQSNGGVSQFDVAARTPLNLIESGPVGGVIGAAVLGRRIGEENILTLDIGGTTAKSSLVEGGEVRLMDDYRINRTSRSPGHPVKVPVVDIIEIGTGGGSIASFDAAGALRVGPRSAGSEPGPACYGRGGTAPTLTDANLLAGRIDPAYFLGGQMSLDVGAARRAYTPLAEQLGVSVGDAALGIIRIANANMNEMLRQISVRRGRDLRAFSIVAMGGGGAMHATALARELQVRRVIVPRHPGHFSALGMLLADLRHDLVQTHVSKLDATPVAELEAVWLSLTDRLLEVFTHEGTYRDDVTLVRTADMRYVGQEHTVKVLIPSGPLTDGDREGIIESFGSLHEQRYTFRLDSPVELVNCRITGLAKVPKPMLPKLEGTGSAEDARKADRLVDFDDAGRVDVVVYERDLLGVGSVVRGPAIVEEPASITVVFPDQTLHVDEFGNLIVEVED